MNLHPIVRGSISSINPETYVKIKKFKSFTIDETGKVKNEYNIFHIVFINHFAFTDNYFYFLYISKN